MPRALTKEGGTVFTEFAALFALFALLALLAVSYPDSQKVEDLVGKRKFTYELQIR